MMTVTYPFIAYSEHQTFPKISRLVLDISIIVTMSPMRNEGKKMKQEDGACDEESDNSTQPLLGSAKRKHDQMKEESKHVSATAFLQALEVNKSQAVPVKTESFSGVGCRLGDSSSNQMSELIDLTTTADSDEEQGSAGEPYNLRSRSQFGASADVGGSSSSSSIPKRLDTNNSKPSCVPVVSRGNTDGNSSSGDDEPDQEVPHTVAVTLFEDGFVVADGPLRSYSDPSCSDIINKINKGEFPSYLIPEKVGIIHVHVVDKREVKCNLPKRNLIAFSGKGHILGSPIPDLTSIDDDVCGSEECPSNRASEAAATTFICSDRRNCFDFSSDDVPSTTLKFRVPDGSVMQMTVDSHITVGTLTEFLTSTRPQLREINFVLTSMFPKQEFTNLQATLEDAGLINSCVIVKPVMDPNMMQK